MLCQSRLLNVSLLLLSLHLLPPNSFLFHPLTTTIEIQLSFRVLTSVHRRFALIVSAVVKHRLGYIVDFDVFTPSFKLILRILSKSIIKPHSLTNPARLCFQHLENPLLFLSLFRINFIPNDQLLVAKIMQRQIITLVFKPPIAFVTIPLRILTSDCLCHKFLTLHPSLVFVLLVACLCGVFGLPILETENSAYIQLRKPTFGFYFVLSEIRVFVL